ncbi:MAG: PKD domain-containing protein, partial [Thermodesulfobacteriota bacterium]
MYNSGTYEYAGYSPVVTGCVFRQNNGNNGGGIYNSGFAIYVGQYPLRITNCIFSQNTATNGGGLYNWNDAAPEIINCSFNQNHANQGGGIYNEDSSSPVLTNCILWGDTADNQAEVYNSDSSPVFSFCNIQGSGGSNSWDSAMGTDNGNNIDTAPLFFDPENGDLHLKYGSPCIDEGDNNAVSGNLWLLKDAITEDMDGDARVVDGNHDDEAVVDMGADEFNSLPIANAGDDATVAGGERVVLDGSASTDSNGTITEWLWEQTEGTKVVLSSPTSAKASFIAPLVPSNESLTFRLTVTDKEGLKDTDICNITVTASSVGGTTSGGGGCFIKAIGD